MGVKIDVIKFLLFLVLFAGCSSGRQIGMIECDFAVEPVMHFDASDTQTVQLDGRGLVISWASKAGLDEFVFVGEGQPRLKDDRIVFDGIDDLMRLRTDKEFNVGDFHIYVVAKSATSKPQVMVGCGDEWPGLKMFSDGKNFRIQSGIQQYKRRCGPKVDEVIHVFEYEHFIAKEITRIWPGNYYVDGKICGKIFNSRKEIIDAANLTIGGEREAKDCFKGAICEIMIFDKKMSAEQKDEIDGYFAKKWGVEFDRWAVPMNLPEMKEVRVGPKDKFSSFGIYDQSPESPDGERIAYVVFDEPITKDNLMDHFELWVCDKDLKNHRLVCKSLMAATSHNGPFTQWLDNDSIAVCGAHSKKVAGVNTNALVYVVNVDSGEIEHGPFEGGFLGDDNYGGKILINVIEDGTIGPRGLYQVDTNCGEVKCLFKTTNFAEYAGVWLGKDDPKKWEFTHSKFSKDGSHLAFTVHSGSGGGQHMFTCKADTSDLKVWGGRKIDSGADKPLHFLWYDGDTFIGADQCTVDGMADDLFVKHWDRYGNYIETLAGPACHLGYSPDKEFYAGENFYRTNPIQLFIYRKGEMTPCAMIFEHEGVNVTWTLGGHVNPSFSRDSKRVYYNRPVDNVLKQAYYCDISSLGGGDSGK